MVLYDTRCSLGNCSSRCASSIQVSFLLTPAPLPLPSFLCPLPPSSATCPASGIYFGTKRKDFGFYCLQLAGRGHPRRSAGRARSPTQDARALARATRERAFSHFSESKKSGCASASRGSLVSCDERLCLYSDVYFLACVRVWCLCMFVRVLVCVMSDVCVCHGVCVCGVEVCVWESMLRCADTDSDRGL